MYLCVCVFVVRGNNCGYNCRQEISEGQISVVNYICEHFPLYPTKVLHILCQIYNVFTALGRV